LKPGSAYYRDVITIGSQSASRWLPALLAAAVLGGCDGGRESSDGLIVGTVTYRERVVLPFNAIVEVRLEAQSPANGLADVLVTRSIATESRQVPIPFELRYPADRVEPNRRYGVRAEIRAANGRLLFASPSPEPVFEHGPEAELVRLLLLRAPAGGAASLIPLPGGGWQLVAMRREQEVAEAMAAEPAYTIEFAADGTVSGSAHCNRYTGRYRQGEAGQLSFSAVTVRQPAVCTPPSRADEFLRALDRVSHFELRGEELLLAYGVGGELTFGRPEALREPGAR
jgi:putative lipoprotein